jgi:hypothetical protein
VSSSHEEQQRAEQQRGERSDGRRSTARRSTTNRAAPANGPDGRQEKQRKHRPVRTHSSELQGELPGWAIEYEPAAQQHIEPDQHININKGVCNSLTVSVG